MWYVQSELVIAAFFSFFCFGVGGWGIDIKSSKFSLLYFIFLFIYLFVEELEVLSCFSHQSKFNLCNNFFVQTIENKFGGGG